MRVTIFTIFIIVAGVVASAMGVKKMTTRNYTTHSERLKTDSIVYKYNKVTAIDHNCKECYLTITYPVIQDKIALRNTINHKLFAYTQSKYITEDFETFFKKFAKTYHSGYKSGDKDFVETFDCDISVQKQDPGLIVMNLGEEMSGGAHPNYHLSFLNWNTQTDKTIKLSDIFLDGYKSKLTAVAKKIFEHNATAKGYKMADYTFDNGIFILNNNFKLTSKGIYFYYNNYEIQSYAEGPTELLIPYASIKHLLRPNTVVTQYIK